MHRYVHHNTTQSIKSLVDVYNFRTEEFVFDLPELEILVPDFVDATMASAPHGASIYCGDEIKPRLILSSSDLFLKKTSKGMEQVDPLTLNNLQGVFLAGNLIKAYTKGLPYVGINYYFGQQARLSLSPRAMRKLLAVRVLELFLKLEDLHSLSSELNIPKLETLYPPADVDAWREYILENQKVQRPKTNQSFYNTQPPSYWEQMESYLPDENGFYFKLIDHLGVNMKGIFRELSLFLNDFRDCLYCLEMNGDRLSVVRGIDHKYIPHYEQKFNIPSEE